jgi:hypothetical protein
MEQVASTQRPDMGSEMDQTVNEGVREGTRFCTPLTRAGLMTHEVRSRLTEEAVWNEQLRPVLGNLTMLRMEVKECLGMEQGGDEVRDQRDENYNGRSMNELPPRQPMTARPTPKLHHFPMRTVRIISNHDSWDEADQDRSSMEMDEEEAEIQGRLVYTGTTTQEKYMYVGSTGIRESVGERWCEATRGRLRF